MKGLPEFGFKCPKCGGVSGGVIWARVERFDSVYNWDPDKNDWKYVDGTDVEVEVDVDSGWRCPACDAVIERPREGLVKLTVVAETVEATHVTQSKVSNHD